ncbi:ergic3 [Symbiodinium necroappetens]|uniref:Ergic3 protein n=1 Tax=Symbiodinium necroappetens TaxID=1628268 RepID=A0A812V6U3_9DINO|nr:ergic3 [Symbiodinium necroappetens]
MRALSRLDLYRKVPRDLTEPTLSGALVSIFTVLVALYLFFAEFTVLIQRRWESEMVIEESKTEEKLQINLDITMSSMPCELLSFDAQDVMGSHEVDAHGNLFKDRLTSKGDLIGTQEIKSSHFGASSTLSRHYSLGYGNQDVDALRKSINSGEGCRIRGFVKVNKVPGNLHLSTYSHSFLFGSLYQETKNLNISHKVNHISFGVDTDITYVKSNFQGTGIVSPLDGVVQIHEKSEPKEKTDSKFGSWSYAGLLDSAIYEYYTKVVPTTYVPLDGSPIHVHQFTANSNKIVNQQMPSLYLRYDFSPVTVRYTETKESLSHFVVQVCAVVGGIFTVAGLLDSVLHKSIVHLAKKAQIGKLG